MKKICILLICIAVLTIECKNDLFKIDKSNLKNDWISVSRAPNEDLYMSILDSFMMENITSGDFPLSRFSISSDTLIIYSPRWDYNTHTPLFPLSATEKFRILRLDSDLFQIKPIDKYTIDTLFFKKRHYTQRNNLKIDRIEFSMSSCFGFCPAQDILISNDSIVYHYGYNIFSRYKGLNKCKLDSSQYTRIQNMIYTIERDSFRFGSCIPDAPRIALFIKSENDSINLEGYPDNNTDQDLMKLVNHLTLLEFTISLKPTDDIVLFKDKWNQKKYMENKN